MKYHAVFVINEKKKKNCNCRLLQIIGGALRVNIAGTLHYIVEITLSFMMKGTKGAFHQELQSVYILYVFCVKNKCNLLFSVVQRSETKPINDILRIPLPACITYN